MLLIPFVYKSVCVATRRGTTLIFKLFVMRHRQVLKTGLKEEERLEKSRLKKTLMEGVKQDFKEYETYKLNKDLYSTEEKIMILKSINEKINKFIKEWAYL